VPCGVVGELYVGGESLSLGYEQRPVRTPSTFVKNPFSAVAESVCIAPATWDGGEPMAVWNILGGATVGLILNGMRVEAGAIEAALVEHPAVCEAAVMPGTRPPPLWLRASQRGPWLAMVKW